MARIITGDLIDDLHNVYCNQWEQEWYGMTIKTTNKCYTKCLIIGNEFENRPTTTSVEHLIDGMVNTMEDIEEYMAIIDYIERWFRRDEVGRRVGQ